ncbi:alpha/beta-hydrolase [Byssothecium circinans]|uniref:Alpha/beta-hydrolase n=1 Tax=Byssothecium circinans TaxID=147558 RepID=A0A6A5T9E4_9PLEO|nr:alpha/beta-hydrolase [Byssothecium circinans]KAF1950847.1 alpha/beta-hydrolase [Byssothecium circinans]
MPIRTITSDPTALTQTFNYQNSTHSYTIKWTSLGDPLSPPLIFIHGTPWSSRCWVPYALALSRQYRVYLSDNAGFGDSPLEELLPGTTFNPPTKVTELDADLARQTEVFVALYRTWEKEWGAGVKPHVIAHDHAGLMSLRAYLLHGCQFQSLCLIDVVAIGPFGQDLFKAMAENPKTFEELPDMAFEGIMESYIRNAAFHDLSKEDMWTLKEPWLRDPKVGKKGFIRQMCQAGSRSTEAVEGRYAEVGKVVPVKIIWGKEDRWIKAEDAYRLGEALGAEEVVVVEKAGHLVMYDQPAQLGIELARWLSTR